MVATGSTAAKRQPRLPGAPIQAATVLSKEVAQAAPDTVPAQLRPSSSALPGQPVSSQLP